MPTPPHRGLLCIWTDVDPVHAQDFNRWYDREHMQERVAIPGFQSARRFAATGPSPRPYLALYFTDSLGVFTSGPYRQAFQNQTPWSLQNFQRMRGTQRRVGTLTVEAGDAGAEGGHLAVLAVPPALLADAAARGRLQAALLVAAREDGVVRASLLQTDATLSTPLTANAAPAPADGLVLLEASRAAAAVAQCSEIVRACGLADAEIHPFQLLWRLGSS